MIKLLLIRVYLLLANFISTLSYEIGLALQPRIYLFTTPEPRQSQILHIRPYLKERGPRQYSVGAANRSARLF